MVVICNFRGEEGFMRKTINGNVNWDGFSVRNWSSERGGKSISIESKVDFRSKLLAGVRPGEEPKTSCGDVCRKVAVD